MGADWRVDPVGADCDDRAGRPADAVPAISSRVRCSQDGRGRYLDNVFTERPFSSLKYEAVYLRELADGRDAERIIGSWVGVYNKLRPQLGAWRWKLAKSSGNSRNRLTSIQPAGNYRLSRDQNQSECTLFSPSDCLTNKDHPSIRLFARIQCFGETNLTLDQFIDAM